MQDALVVRLLPGWLPNDEVERHLYAALLVGPLPFRNLVDRVSERLFREEVAQGGWVAEIGVWGPGIYNTEVTRVVRMLEGSGLVIESGSA
jgi:hypothetical protein